MSEERNLRSSLLWMSPRLVVGFGLAVATLVLVSAVTVNALSRRTLNGQSVHRSFEVLRTTQRLLAEIDSSQLALTDFVLTGDATLLEPYQTARRSIPNSLRELQALTSRRPTAQRQIEELRPVLNQAIELDAIETTQKQHGATFDELRPMMLESRSLLKRSSALLDQIKEDTHPLLDTEQKALDDSIRASSLVVVLGDVVLLALILAAGVVAFGDAAEKARAVQFQRRILGMVGHDLRNPLSVVMMSATQLAKNTDGADRRQGAISRILSATDRMEKMIRDLLDYSRIELHMALPLDIRPSDVDSCCQRVIEEFRTVHPGREIRYEARGPAQVSWDSDRIERVLENLVSNALKYSPKESAVGVAWRREEERVILEVKNDGVPIPDALLPHIFEPFRRGSGHDAGIAKQSLGLGLYIVRHIVQQHGGEIRVESSADSGTTFTVAVPQPVRASVAA